PPSTYSLQVLIQAHCHKSSATLKRSSDSEGVVPTCCYERTRPDSCGRTADSVMPSIAHLPIAIQSNVRHHNMTKIQSSKRQRRQSQWKSDEPSKYRTSV